ARGQRAGASDEPMTLLRDKKPMDFGSALALARSAARQRDYITTIQVLSEHGDKVRQDYQASLVLGEAYQGILLYEDAFYLYEAARKLRPHQGEPDHRIGAMYLAARNWERALRHLERAEALGYADRQ